MAKEKNVPNEQEVFKFLHRLRESGRINMFGAPSVLVQAYGISLKQAIDLFTKWTKTFDTTA